MNIPSNPVGRYDLGTALTKACVGHSSALGELNRGLTKTVNAVVALANEPNPSRHVLFQGNPHYDSEVIPGSFLNSVKLAVAVNHGNNTGTVCFFDYFQHDHGKTHPNAPNVLDHEHLSVNGLFINRNFTSVVASFKTALTDVTTLAQSQYRLLNTLITHQTPATETTTRFSRLPDAFLKYFTFDGSFMTTNEKLLTLSLEPMGIKKGKPTQPWWQKLMGKKLESGWFEQSIAMQRTPNSGAVPSTVYATYADSIATKDQTEMAQLSVIDNTLSNASQPVQALIQQGLNDAIKRVNYFSSHLTAIGQDNQ
jgi:hypothetical protein